MLVKSCRLYPFLPKSREELIQRLFDCQESVELTLLIRLARKEKLWMHATKAHKRLVVLRKAARKGLAPSAPPKPCEVSVAVRAWDGRAEGYGDKCVVVQPGTMCEVWKRDASGWALVVTNEGGRGWQGRAVLPFLLMSCADRNMAHASLTVMSQAAVV
eukprot:2047926-Amphidinium_carterae.1